MTGSAIDFSAQFGGLDAAAVVLPHFSALKAAASQVSIEKFPFPKLAFILRVDGEIRQYGFSGIAHPDIDRKGEYLSLDIGITIGDRQRLVDVISSAIRSSLDSISILNAKHSWGMSLPLLKVSLDELVAEYPKLIPVK